LKVTESDLFWYAGRQRFVLLHVLVVGSRGTFFRSRIVMYSRVSPHRRHSRIYKYMARPGDRGGYKSQTDATAVQDYFSQRPDTAHCSAQSSPHITYGFKPAHSAIHYSLHHTTSRTWNTNTRSYPIPNRTRRSKHHSPSIPRMPAAARGGASQMRTTVRALRPRGLTAEAEPTHCAALHPSRTRGASGGGGGGRLADERSRVGLSATSRSGAL